MQVDQDLAALFHRNLTFNPQTVEPTPEPNQQTTVYSISQHYHHSGHAARPNQQDEPPRSMSEPPRMTCEMLLRQNGVDPSSLSPSQMQLFRIADMPQQERLVELWRICPPNNSADDPSLAWTATTLEQEENIARMRFQRQQEELARREQEAAMQQQNNMVMSLDGTPIQAGDGRWLTMTSTTGHEDSEPYMVAGYMDLMQELGYDPHSHHHAASPAKDAYTHFGTPVGGQTYASATDPVYNMGPADSAPRGFHSFHGPAGMHMDTMDVVM